MVKKVLTAVALCMVYIAMTAQEKTYVVQRGETLQSIAQKFGVSEYRIQECNWNVKTYYAGWRIKLPAITEERTPNEVFAYEMAHKKLEEAKQEMEKGKTYTIQVGEQSASFEAS
jgi:spore germination protein YaaH